MLLLTTLIWGGTFSSTKALLSGSLRPMGLLTWRFGLAAIIFSVAYRRSIYRNIDRRTILYGIALGALLYAGFGLQTVGLGLTSSSRSGFITALYVVFTPLMQIFIIRTAPGRNVMIGIILVLLGLWGLTAPGGTFAGLLTPWSSGGFGVGDLLTLGCALAFAGYIILLDRAGTSTKGIAALTSVQLTTTAILCSTHCLIAEPWSAPSTGVELGLMFFLAFFASVLATYWQTAYQRYTTPSRAAVIYTMESVFSAAIAAVMLDERLGAVGVVGGVLIVAGLLVTELGGGKR
jgi:drug/metabolite transporter (DMT)-like permease